MQTRSPASDETELRASWLPLVVVALGQALLSINVSALLVSIGGILDSLDAPPTTVGNAVVLYSLGVSGFILLGGKLSQRVGPARVFRGAILVFGVAMAATALTGSATMLAAAQGFAGLAAAALVPTLAALVAAHYQGRQQAEALGWVGAAGAMASVLAFVVGGAIGTFLHWRVTFGLMTLLAAAACWLSFRLDSAKGDSHVRIDAVGVILAAASVILIATGFNTLRGWGALLARPAAPFDLVGVSPAPVAIVFGLVLGMAFVAWSSRRAAARQTPLLALEVAASPGMWAAIVAVLIIGATEAAINFAVPLYVQVVQGRTSLATAVALMPLMLAVFASAALVVRLFDRTTPRRIAAWAFVLVATGTAWLAVVVRNEWNTVPVIAGLLIAGLGQGALLTLLFHVLVSGAPTELAGDVGSLRGVAQNLAAAVGTAFIGALLVGLLTMIILGHLKENRVISAELRDEVNLDNMNFFSDEQIHEQLAETSASPNEFAEALRINAVARTRALKVGFLVLSGLALLAVVPCYWLPDSSSGDVHAPLMPADAEFR